MVALLVWLAVPSALHQIGHALSYHPAHTSGVPDRMLIWLQTHLHRLPTGTQLVHPVASYGQKAGEAVVAIFFMLAATWYCVSERDAIIKLLTAFTSEASATRRVRRISRSTGGSARTRGSAS